MWTRKALQILDDHYDHGRAAAQKALADAGYQYTLVQITNAASTYGISNPPRASLLGQATNALTSQQVFTGGWFSRPPRVADRLAELAETKGLTLAEYERRKAEILGEA